MAQLKPEERRAHLIRARELFNAGDYWAAHEALETVWRSIISDDAASVWQGLIPAAAALLHLRRGNRHGATGAGRGAVGKARGRRRPGVGFETVQVGRHRAPALAWGRGRP